MDGRTDGHRGKEEESVCVKFKRHCFGAVASLYLGLFLLGRLLRLRGGLRRRAGLLRSLCLRLLGGLLLLRGGLFGGGLDGVWGKGRSRGDSQIYHVMSKKDLSASGYRNVFVFRVR